MVWLTALAAIAAYARLAIASTVCPLPDLCFSVSIPDVSTGGVFLQITAPAALGNVTLAHGHPENRADYFFVDADSRKPNIKISRLLVGKDQDDPDAEIDVLSGSGIKHDRITANIRCSTCDLKRGGSMDLTTSIASWNWTYRAVATSTNMPISGKFNFGPYAGNSPTQHEILDTPMVSRAFHIPPRIVKMAMVHGALACMAWAFIFPLGGILARLFPSRKIFWVHVGLQVSGLCLYTAAVGLGINLGINPRHRWIKNKHAIIGLILYGLLFLQTASGYIHHLMFKKYLSRTTWSYIHLWTGRLCITLAMANAGFGFQLRHQELGSWKVLLYTVCAVLMWIAYVSSAVLGEWRRKRQAKGTTSALEGGISAEGSSTHTPEMIVVPKQG